ncbi:protein TRI1 [Euphorbia lathyris]|uniref:protein TRI1 n=1 Tax=Euphorbia lathyris TaxID=212925 RepID=UPI003313A836
MSFVTSRVFRGCRALLAPAKSSAAASKPTATKAAASKPKSAKPARTAGILKPFPVSPALSDFLGTPEASRAGAVKQIWAYIKQNNLQNPANKKEIFCDAKLKSIFDDKEKVGFLEIGKLLSQHFVKTT